MSKIVILAETGSDITEEVAKEYGIKISADARLLWKRYEE